MESFDERLLGPLTRTGGNFFTFVAALLAVEAWAAFAWWTQVSYGFQVTGLNNTVVWGLYIANFVFLIGISHAGILISATVRILKLRRYRPVARMAEVLTLVSLVMAVLSVVADLGRPDRWYNMLLSIQISSPLAWDFTFIALYFTLSALYLFLSLRDDIARCEGSAAWRRGLFRLLMRIYDKVTPRDHEKYEGMLNRFALVVLPFPVFGSGMVVPFIFSVLVAKPTWNVPFFGPYFLSALFRRVYDWEEVLRPEVFRGLGDIMIVLIPVYVYFTFLEQFTSQYVRAATELAVSDYLLSGPYALIFWSMVIFGFIVPFFVLIASRSRTVNGVYLAALMVSIGLWIKRVIIVVPTLVQPNLPFDIGSYNPTWVEWSVLVGIFAFGALLYSMFVKLFPIIELDI
ncbi:MAG: NrfD/PsrC family molybdoenzyme membrane anchor subunit [Candidatus Bathyarchaeia archaeon]